VGTAVKPQREFEVERLPIGDGPAVAETRVTRHRTFEHLREIWNARRTVIRAVGVGVVVGLLLAFLIPTKYRSTTQLMPPDQQSGSGIALMASLLGRLGGGGSSSGSSGGIGGLAGDLFGLKTSGDLYIGVLQSRTVQDDLITKFDLRKLYKTSRWEDARKKLSDNTEFSNDRKSGLIKIEVTDHDPSRAAAMGQEYVSELNYVMTLLNTSSAHRERVFLEDRLQQVKVDLEAAEKDFSEYASKNATLDITAQGKAMVESAATLQGQLIAAETELQGLRQIYTDNNVRVKAMQARINELQLQLQKMGGKAGTAADTDTPDSQSLYPSIRRLPLLGVNYADLFRRMKVQEAIFETLTQQYELARVQEAKEVPTVRTLDSPDIPGKKSFPPRLLITFLCALFALIGALTWILARARWHEIDPGDPGKTLATEVFQAVQGHMPWAEPNGSRMQALSHRAWMKLARPDDPPERN
jgi:capsule polysaccharide export protein KpsE/RkpR